MQRGKLLVALYYKTRNRWIVDDAVLHGLSSPVTVQRCCLSGSHSRACICFDQLSMTSYDCERTQKHDWAFVTIKTKNAFHSRSTGVPQKRHSETMCDNEIEK